MRRPALDSEVVELFLNAYRQGAFPMAELPDTPPKDGKIPTARAIHWYAPDPRAILELNEGGLHVPSGLRRKLKKAPFVLTGDACFERVIRACAKPTQRRGGMWLDETLIRCYTLLHERGHAHSIEAWADEDSAELLGGIYGVSIGSAFFAESMFSDLENGGSGASGACLVALWHHLRACGYTLMDLQLANDHTRRFGLAEIPLDEYLERLENASARSDAWRPFDTKIAADVIKPKL